MLQWVRDYQQLLYWLGGASVAILIAALALVPPMIARIPADYFAHRHRPARRWAEQHRALRIAISTGKNILGYLCIVTGLVMLVLPGPGLLTLLAGFLLVDFPGKYRFEQWIISRKRVLAAVNWFRARRGREPLEVSKEGTEGRRDEGTKGEPAAG